jgi:hypothetical protein
MYFISDGTNITTSEKLTDVVEIIATMIDVDHVPKAWVRLFQGNEVIPLPYSPPAPPATVPDDGIKFCSGISYFTDKSGVASMGSHESLHNLSVSGQPRTELMLRPSLQDGGGYLLDWLATFQLQSKGVESIVVKYSGRTANSYLRQQMLLGDSWKLISEKIMGGGVTVLNVPVSFPKIKDDGTLTLRFFYGGVSPTGFALFVDYLALDVKYIRV